MSHHSKLCKACGQQFMNVDPSDQNELCPCCWRGNEEYKKLVVTLPQFHEYDNPEQYYLTAKQALNEFAARMKLLMRALDKAGVQYSFDHKRRTCQVKTGSANVSVEVPMAVEEDL